MSAFHQELQSLTCMHTHNTCFHTYAHTSGRVAILMFSMNECSATICTLTNFNTCTSSLQRYVLNLTRQSGGHRFFLLWTMCSIYCFVILIASPVSYECLLLNDYWLIDCASLDCASLKPGKRRRATLIIFVMAQYSYSSTHTECLILKMPVIRSKVITLLFITSLSAKRTRTIEMTRQM